MKKGLKFNARVNIFSGVFVARPDFPTAWKSSDGKFSQENAKLFLKEVEEEVEVHSRA